MQFDDYFKIYVTRDDTISLEEALKIAKANWIADMVYDPLGYNSDLSWWWIAGVLEVLQQEDLIREFKVLKEAPAEQQIESEEGVVY